MIYCNLKKKNYKSLSRNKVAALFAICAFVLAVIMIPFVNSERNIQAECVVTSVCD